VDSYVPVAYRWRMTVGPGTYQLGPAQGRVEIRTSRVGIAARAGHDLLIEVTKWQARIEVPETGGVASAAISADLDLGSLAVREGTGGARPLGASDRADIEKTMREMLLGGAGTAMATFTSTRVVPSNVGGAIEGTVTFRGATQPVRLQVSEPSPGHYRGTGTVSQSGFGITPYTGFFGALKVRDEVIVELDLHLG
jgi:polyisoprenoid-binding protein YceI